MVSAAGQDLRRQFPLWIGVGVGYEEPLDPLGSNLWQGRWPFSTEMGEAVSAKGHQTAPQGSSDVWASLCPPLVCHYSSWYKTAPAKCGPTRPVPHTVCGSCKVPGRPTVLSVVPAWMLILGRCTETLILAGKSVFQGHSEVTESSELVRLFRHTLNKITASIFSDWVIICLMKKRMSFTIHTFVCET